MGTFIFIYNVSGNKDDTDSGEMANWGLGNFGKQEIGDSW